MADQGGHVGQMITGNSAISTFIEVTTLAGPVAYGWRDTTPDLRATCRWVRFETVETLHDCMND
ncbi:MAG: hypothetical protein H6712_09985 [Myxococcales bacterium]|nr:hypothetical protein [Myxococcales bacterium]